MRVVKRRQFPVALKIGGMCRLSGRRRRNVIGAVLVVGISYYLLGVMIFPGLLVPIGCSGTLGTPIGETVPNTELDISYESDTETVTVEHVGGAVLYDNRTDQVTVTIESSQETRRFNWTEVGGTYPIREGDSVSISNIPRSSDPEAKKIIRVMWTGQTREPEYPIYCPGSGGNPRSTESATLSRSEI